jgi:broad specificity phosphatase PhoE
MTRVFLVRHGNTFLNNDKIVWVGARTNLKLTPEGRHQATELGLRLKELSINPAMIYCGPLLRTTEHAAILNGNLSHPSDIKIIPNLMEIDYGAWEGLSSAEIEFKGAGDELAKWDKNSVWPESPNWQPHASVIHKQCGDILTELAHQFPQETVVLISSNGILRFFADHTDHQNNFENFKMKTGHVSEIEHDGKIWHICSWNQPPKNFSFRKQPENS